MTPSTPQRTASERLMKTGSIAHTLRRTREVGVQGVARRLLHPAREAMRSTQRRRWGERYACGAGPPLDPATLGGGLGLADLQRALASGPFFLPARNPALVERFHREHPAAKWGILDQAEAALAGDLSWVVPGGRPDWHAILPAGGRWPLCEPGETGISAPDPPGDVRLTWEIGRCPHLVRLAQAAWITGELRFARAAVGGIRSFIDENPPGLGIGWAHAQEVGLRAVAWLWVFRLVRDLDAFDQESFGMWLGGLVAHAEFVAAHLSDHILTHNHLVSEVAALSLLGLSLDALPLARSWRGRGLRLLAREVRKQVDDEGVQGEFSTHYHGFVFDSCIATVLLADRAGWPLAKAFRERVGRMADFLAYLVRSDGTLPAIGDSDAGRAFRLGLNPLDRRDSLAAAAIAFGREDWGAIAGDAPGAFWLGGGASVPGARGATPAGASRCFVAAGIAVARTGFDQDAEMVVFRAGATSFRRDVQRSHAHADALSFVWQFHGSDVIVDPGVFLYSENAGWRRALRRTAAHACVVVDGQDQADVTSLRFGVLGLEASRWLSCEASATSLTAVAEHPATGPLRVRRELSWRRGGLIVLRDWVLGRGEHEIVLCLPLPECEGEIRGTEAIFRLASGLQVRVQSVDQAVLVLHRPGAGGELGPGWLAPRYGERLPGALLEIRLGRAGLPRETLTVLQVANCRLPSAAFTEGLPGGGLRVIAEGCAVDLAAAPEERISP